MTAGELEVPWRATITTFSEADQVGRLRVASGEDLRFGRSACQGFIPVVGMEVFVTVVGDHPLGGRKALKVRPKSITEQDVRNAEADQAARATAQAAEEAAKRRERVTPLTSPEQIVRRVKESVLADEDYDADSTRLYELVDDLELVGRSPSHVRAILQGIAESHPMAHFGSPGPLVHYVEKSQGFEEVLFELAASVPTFHFLWMLGRCVNGGLSSARALSLIRAFSENQAVPESLRLEAASFVAKQEEG